MYMLVEGKESSTYEMIYCELEKAITRCIDEKSLRRWELIGIDEDNSEIHIATFSEESHAYQALRQLFEIITRGDQKWDVIQFKAYLESAETSETSTSDIPF